MKAVVILNENTLYLLCKFLGFLNTENFNLNQLV